MPRHLNWTQLKSIGVPVPPEEVRNRGDSDKLLESWLDAHHFFWQRGVVVYVAGPIRPSDLWLLQAPFQEVQPRYPYGQGYTLTQAVRACLTNTPTWKLVGRDFVPQPYTIPDWQLGLW